MNPVGRHPERGLALLLVVTLLALVTLLVVSFAIITRVETQVSSTVVDRAQARANALFALDVAMGRLQVVAGPDQRATRSAHLMGVTGHPHRAGVWSTDDSTAAPLAEATVGTSPNTAKSYRAANTRVA